jgi:hypothetical protein
VPPKPNRATVAEQININGEFFDIIALIAGSFKRQQFDNSLQTMAHLKGRSFARISLCCANISNSILTGCSTDSYDVITECHYTNTMRTFPTSSVAFTDASNTQVIKRQMFTEQARQMSGWFT